MVGLRFDRDFDSRYTVDIFFLFRIPLFFVVVLQLN